jgi:galactose-1-phosphate uridylyltransferase
MKKESRSGCPFCEESVESRIIARKGTVIAIRDKFPVTDLHTLILPLRHVSDFFDLSPEEKADADSLLSSLRHTILKEDPSVTPYLLVQAFQHLWLVLENDVCQQFTYVAHTICS